MNRPDFATASRKDICAYAMTLEMLNSNLTVIIQRQEAAIQQQEAAIQQQEAAIQQQEERLSALEDQQSKYVQTIDDLKYNLERSKKMYQNLARIHCKRHICPRVP